MMHSHPTGTPLTSLAIADAVIRIIARDGFDAVSIRSAAHEAGFAAGTIQHHYHSRDDLLVGALHRTVERQLARIQLQSEIGEPTDRLHTGLGALLPIDDIRRE